ncbi:MAG: metallophosphoesterase family protein [Anaerolineales bacterium]
MGATRAAFGFLRSVLSSLPMRVLVISDIHANLVALEAVLEDAAGEYDVVWCLGDLVGYGPDPNECVERVQTLPGLRCLIGNHDAAAIGDIDLGEFNPDARAAVAWTQNALSSGSLDYIENLPDRDEQGPFTLVHGSPRQPVWEYILDRHIAMQNFRHFQTEYCLVGHTHIPVVYRRDSGRQTESPPDYCHALVLNGDRFILNPGSVGQPRDGDPDAAYALLDTEALRWQHRRAPYEVAETQRRMDALDFPTRLIVRLSQGW